jgi:mono/diheme cytochrome c family protein
MHRYTHNRWIATASLVFLIAVSGCTDPDVTEAQEAAGEEEEEGGVATQSTCPPASDLDYTTFGRQFMLDYCTSCHSSELTGGARGGAPDGYDFDSLEGVLAELHEIDTWAAAGPAGVNTAMPPVPPYPTEDERRKLGEWLACESAN